MLFDVCCIKSHDMFGEGLRLGAVSAVSGLQPGSIGHQISWWLIIDNTPGFCPTVTGIGDPILSLCVYFPLLSICITWLPSILVSSSHMWQFIFFYLSNHHYIYSASYHIPPWSIASDLSLAGFLNTLLEVFSHGTALYTYHLPVSPSWGFIEKEQRSCNGFPKHQQSPLDTC